MSSKSIKLICLILAFIVGWVIGDILFDSKNEITPCEIRLVGDGWNKAITWTLPAGEFVENWTWRAKNDIELIRVIDANGLHFIKPKPLKE